MTPTFTFIAVGKGSVYSSPLWAVSTGRFLPTAADDDSCDADGEATIAEQVVLSMAGETPGVSREASSATIGAAGLPFLVAAGGGGSGATGIKNALVVGWIDNGEFKKCAEREIGVLPHAVAVAPSGKHVAYTGAKMCGILAFSHAKDALEPICEFVTEPDAGDIDANCLAWSPNGAFLATGGDSGVLRVWGGLPSRRTDNSHKSVSRSPKAVEMNFGFVEKRSMAVRGLAFRRWPAPEGSPKGETAQILAVGCSDPDHGAVLQIVKVGGTFTEPTAEPVAMLGCDGLSPKEYRAAQCNARLKPHTCAGCAWTSVAPRQTEPGRDRAGRNRAGNSAVAGTASVVWIAVNGPWESRGIGRNRRMKQHASYLVGFAQRDASVALVGTDVDEAKTAGARAWRELTRFLLPGPAESFASIDVARNGASYLCVGLKNGDVEAFRVDGVYASTGAYTGVASCSLSRIASLSNAHDFKVPGVAFLPPLADVCGSRAGDAESCKTPNVVPSLTLVSVSPDKNCRVVLVSAAGPDRERGLAIRSAAAVVRCLLVFMILFCSAVLTGAGARLWAARGLVRRRREARLEAGHFSTMPEACEVVYDASRPRLSQRRNLVNALAVIKRWGGDGEALGDTDALSALIVRSVASLARTGVVLSKQDLAEVEQKVVTSRGKSSQWELLFSAATLSHEACVQSILRAVEGRLSHWCPPGETAVKGRKQEAADINRGRKLERRELKREVELQRARGTAGRRDA
jgi:hypothetical protein